MASNYPALELCKISTLSLFFFCFFFNIWPFPPQIKGAYSAGTSIKTKKDADPLITMFSFMAAINQFPDRLTSILKERQGWGGLETVSILIIAFIVAYSQAKLFPDVSCSGVVSHARTRAISTNASADSSVNIFLAMQKSLEKQPQIFMRRRRRIRVCWALLALKDLDWNFFSCCTVESTDVSCPCLCVVADLDMCSLWSQLTTVK